MLVIYKKVGEAPRPLLIDGKLEDMQELVEGWVKEWPISDKLWMFCNEEGELRGLPKNFTLASKPVYGNVFFCGIERDEDEIRAVSCPRNAFEIKMMLEGMK